MRIKSLLLVAAVLGLMACSWVKLTAEGEKVRVLSQPEVSHCKKIGKTTATVANRVAGLQRKEKIIQDNLDVLARNAAAEMGGDTVVRISSIEAGKQTFAVYRCIEP